MTTIDPRLSRAFAEANGFALAPQLIVLALMGSHSHGTYVPPTEPDAVDVMGFVVPPVEHHLGLPRWSHWVFQFEELDVVIYSLEKAFRLLLKSNPNIVGLLWLREDEYVYRHPLFDRLRTDRAVFSSQEAADAFSGYAFDQLKRMEAFDTERMAEYETLTAEMRARGPIVTALNAAATDLERIAQDWGISPDVLVRFRKLHREHFSGYMGEKRKAMVRKYKYDVKNAAHLIRLLRMGSEFLRTGTLTVYRTADAAELKSIKQGAWTLEQVKAEAERLFEGIDLARAASPLPAAPDHEAANRLLIEMHRTMLGL